MLYPFKQTNKQSKRSDTAFFLSAPTECVWCYSVWCLGCNHQQSHPTTPTCHGVLQHIVVTVIIGYHRLPQVSYSSQLLTHFCGCPREWGGHGHAFRHSSILMPIQTCTSRCHCPMVLPLPTFLPPTVTTGDLQQCMSHAVKFNRSLLISFIWEKTGLFFRILLLNCEFQCTRM